MGRLALLHKGRLVDGKLPPMEVLEALVERTPNHWYWLGEFYDDNLDRSAEFLWAPPNENPVKFMVPKLLWQLTNPEVDTKRILLENTCGLFTCINPGHWRKRLTSIRIPARIVLPDSVEATPVVYPHVMVSVHIQRHGSLHPVCGGGKGWTGLHKSAPITCDDCISSWVRTGQPYLEVK